jgi:phospholipase C
MIRRGLFAIIIVILMASGQSGRVQAASGSKEPQPKTPIQHLVVLMQENHTFDNYFGTYPGVNGIQADTKMPVNPSDLSQGYITPWHIGSFATTDLSHSAATFHDQYNGGKMDSFIYALDLRNQDGRLAMGYYDGRDIPYYWNLADNYVLFDHFFSSARDGSGANHMFWVVGAQLSTNTGQSLSEQLANTQTIFDRLQAAGVSWKFYVQNYDPTITYRDLGNVGNRESQVIWVPLLNIDRFIDDPTLSSHIVDLSQYYVDLHNGNLPAVSYIVPSGDSEHPPSSLLSGQLFVKSLIQELMRSSAWNNSAFLLAYDDWGGWYDHVNPPQVDANGYGMRVPALLVSAYAKKGSINSTQLDFTSILKFIENNWGIAPLADRDAKANDIISAFDFNQQPRQPEILSLTRGSAAPAKIAPTKVIYSAYGLALVLSVLVIGIAFISSLWLKVKKHPRSEAAR